MEASLKKQEQQIQEGHQSQYFLQNHPNASHISTTHNKPF